MDTISSCNSLIGFWRTALISLPENLRSLGTCLYQWAVAEMMTHDLQGSVTKDNTIPVWGTGPIRSELRLAGKAFACPQATPLEEATLAAVEWPRGRALCPPEGGERETWPGPGSSRFGCHLAVIPLEPQSQNCPQRLPKFLTHRNHLR